MTPGESVPEPPDWLRAWRRELEESGFDLGDVVHRRLVLPEADDRSTAQDFEREQKQLELNQKQTEVDKARQTLALREDHSEKLFLVMVGWLIGVFLILLLHGCKTNHFSLADNVLVTLLAATTAKVVGLFYLVTGHLFPKRD